MKRFVTIGGTV